MILGNIHKRDIKDILSPESEPINQMIDERLYAINACQSKECNFFFICNGGCPYYSFIKSNGKNLKESDWLCEGKILVFKYIKDVVKLMKNQSKLGN
jgi:radical SAM protein with 4Fe4S-binding SPASM domain